jgi:hypothetical protein
VDLCVEAGEVEAVGDVLFVDFAEVLIAAGGDELEIMSVIWFNFWKLRGLK